MTTPPVAIDSVYADWLGKKIIQNGRQPGTHLASGYNREKVQTGSRVMDKLPSLDVMTTLENPSDAGCESIRMSREESRSHSAEVCVKMRGGTNESR
jgi:hypothetical protein